MSAVTEALAAEILDAWCDISRGLDHTWAHATTEHRRTARIMANAALAAGRAGDRSRDDVAKALSTAFAQDSVNRGRPNEAWVRWETCGQGHRNFWLLMADRFLARAAALKAERARIAA
jgi:hypothetical protein